MKPLRKKLKVPVYNSEVVITFCDDAAVEYNRMVRKGKAIGKEYDATEISATRALSLSDVIGTYHIILPFDATGGLIAHECFHTVCDVLCDHDVPINRDNQEPGAYLIEYIYSQIEKIKSNLTKKQNDNSSNTNPSTVLVFDGPRIPDTSLPEGS